MLLRRLRQHVQEQDWFAIGLDLIVVVVGIFLAFQVDRWYASKSQEISSDQLIGALVEDFAYNRNELSYIMGRQEVVADSASKAFEARRANGFSCGS